MEATAASGAQGAPNKPWALVTGGSRGIGAAISKALAAAGHPILLNYRSNDAAAEAVKAEIEAKAGQVRLLRFDVVDREATFAAIDALVEEGLPIGVLVNNAGVSADNAFPMMTPEQWDPVMRVNLDGFYNVTQKLVMPMIRLRKGRIITVSSVSGVIGNRGQVNYSAAKAGLIGATKALAIECAKRGVTVNAVAPGLIETDMVVDAPLDIIKKHIPMRRFGQPEEVAGLVAYLASDAAGYITGQCISISGGL